MCSRKIYKIQHSAHKSRSIELKREETKKENNTQQSLNGCGSKNIKYKRSYFLLSGYQIPNTKMSIMDISPQFLKKKHTNRYKQLQLTMLNFKFNINATFISYCTG